MTENKRFGLNCKLGLVNGEEPLCKCLLDNGKHKSYREWVDLLNNLIDENEQIKQQLEYIQNLISEHIEHQKTELGQKALQKIIEDYNEWLLGHNRDLND